VDLALLIGSGGLDKQRIWRPCVLPSREEEHTICRRVWFRRQRIGRSRFERWRKNAGFHLISPRCLRCTGVPRSYAGRTDRWRGMTESGSESPPFECPEQENIRLQEETPACSARSLRRRRAARFRRSAWRGDGMNAISSRVHSRSWASSGCVVNLERRSSAQLSTKRTVCPALQSAGVHPPAWENALSGDDFR